MTHGKQRIFEFSLKTGETARKYQKRKQNISQPMKWPNDENACPEILITFWPKLMATFHTKSHQEKPKTTTTITARPSEIIKQNFYRNVFIKLDSISNRSHLMCHHHHYSLCVWCTYLQTISVDQPNMVEHFGWARMCCEDGMRNKKLISKSH